MAVILLDGLADALLYRHLEDLYRASEEPFTRGEMPRYPKKLRREAKMQFGVRVELARKVTYWDEMRRDGIPSSTTSTRLFACAQIHALPMSSIL